MFLAVITIDGERGEGSPGFAENRFAWDTADGDMRAEMKGVTHEELAFANLDGAAAQGRNVIDRSLEDAIVRSIQVGGVMANVW